MDNVIYFYTDAQAVADGVLFPCSIVTPAGTVNRITNAVYFDVKDTDALASLARRVMEEPKKDGWHVREEDGKTFWAIPNEHGAFTLMYPDDY